MSLWPGLPVAVIIGSSVVLAPSPQLGAPTSALIGTPLGQLALKGRVIPSAGAPRRSAPSLDSRVAAAGADVSNLDAELVCMAKAVRHEAANQPLKGQLALAQLIMNRVRSPLFPKTVCAVVNQSGQFFRTAGYRPRASEAQWRTAVGIARIARQDADPALVPGALFYNASDVRPRWPHRRAEVARIGGQVFYR